MAYQAEYIWIDGAEPTHGLRSKTRIIANGKKPEIWGFDGSSTNQATGSFSDCVLVPVFTCPDPLRGKGDILVLCEVLNADMTPHATNTRHAAAEAAKKYASFQPMFGIEQEYILYRKDIIWPLGFPVGGYPKFQALYYCGVGSDNIVGRAIMDAHYRACLHCDIKISGTNAEVMPGQWEFQIGPCEGITSCDEMWLARYLLLRCAELYGVTISWHPKPLASKNWNGSGCHTNFSTESTRNNGGLDVILDYIRKLGKHHQKYITLTGVDNDKRMSGACETSDLNVFSYGVANRGASIRIPRGTSNAKKGYFEDRRPASNMDPYVITAAVFDITVNGGKNLEIIVEAYKKYLSALRR